MERLEQTNNDAYVGSIGDSYDNALAETINGLCKTEVISIADRGVILTMWNLLLWNGEGLV